MDTQSIVFLSRLQFAITIMFHYLFPPLTIGMGIVLVYLEGMFLWTKEPIYESAARFWTQIFAVTFAVGVATGIVMEFQFGTNWAVYSRFVGDVFGSALAAEGIFAFFLESGFLAILVFGWDRVGPKFHFFATLMVSLGSIFSSVWIVVANSWQQTPAGHHIVQMMRDGKPWVIDGKPVMRAEIVDFWKLLFNPSAPDRLVHTLIGAFIMGAFFIMSISAYYLLKRRHEEFAKRSFTGALILATVFSLAQLISGHANAKMVAHYQPAKLAAFEGHFHTGPADLNLFGLPDESTKIVRAQIALPGMLSFLVSGDTHTPITGLDQIRREWWPPVKEAFATYHLMIAIGMFFIALTLYASFLRWRGTLFEKRWLLWVFVGAVALAVLANQLGWVSAEIGRQPWTVHPSVLRDPSGAPLLDASGFLQYNLEEGLLTSRAISESISSGQVISSIAMFGFVYLLLLAVWIFVLNEKIQHGPEPITESSPGTIQGIVEAAAGRVGHNESLSETKD
jgi:cytochrome d ubiquinol oxidase subunit I